jgi:malonyl-CoA O-methyltransferase
MLKTAFDKTVIKRCFSRAASTYDEFSGFQRMAALEVMKRLSAIASSSSLASPVLDIGCGTGFLLELIKSSIADVRAYGSDIALPMLCRARENTGQAHSGLIASDCESLPFRDESFAIAASSLTFQWAQELSVAFSEAFRILKRGGLFIFSTLGPETLGELKECYPGYQGIEFRESADIRRTLEEAGFEEASVESKIIKMRYDSFMDLLRTLKHIGASPALECGKGLSPGRALKEAGRAYAERFPASEGGVLASYELIVGAAKKL